MGLKGTQDQMLCSVHLPHGVRAREPSRDSFINSIVLAVLLRCQKKYLETYFGPLTMRNL